MLLFPIFIEVCLSQEQLGHLPYVCHESQVIIFEAKLEALELHSLDCYNEICAIEPQFRDRSKYEDAAESARECFDKIIQKYRSKQSQEGKLLNRGMVEIKQELVDQFYRMFGKTIKKCPRCQSAVSELKFEVNGQTKVLVQKCFLIFKVRSTASVC